MSRPSFTFPQLMILCELAIDGRFGAGAFKDDRNTFETLAAALKSKPSPLQDEAPKADAPKPPTATASTPATPAPKLGILQQFNAINDPVERGKFYEAHERELIAEMSRNNQ